MPAVEQDRDVAFHEARRQRQRILGAEPHVEDDGVEPVGLGEGPRSGEGRRGTDHLRPGFLQRQLEIEREEEFVLDDENSSPLQ